MIRAAKEEDFPRMLEMGRAFFIESGFNQEAEWDDESTLVMFRQVLSGGGLFVSDYGGQLVGMVGALAFPFYFNAHHMTAQELFWWVSPEYRRGVSGMKLLRAVEQWAKDKGCKTMMMISLPKLADSPAAAVYEKTGYRASEQTFIKVI